MLQELSQWGIPLVIVSLAHAGCLFSYKSKVYAMPSFTVTCKDPVGAGDAFNAGLITWLGEHRGTTLDSRLQGSEENICAAMLKSSACGAMAVTENGCYNGVQASAVMRLIEEQGKRVLGAVREV